MRAGHSHDEAEDPTQDLRESEKAIVDLTANGTVPIALLGALKHFVANERDAARALKRGGGRAAAFDEIVQADQDTAPSSQRPDTDRSSSASGR
jgi:hypothetical protein